MKRTCIRCDAPLIACSGFVLARDFLMVVNGYKLDIAREHCGRCAVSLFDDLGSLPPITESESKLLSGLI